MYWIIQTNSLPPHQFAPESGTFDMRAESSFTREALEVWENEGGLFFESSLPKLMGMESRINRQKARRTGYSIGARDPRRQFAGVTAEDDAGYLIHDLEKLRDQARRMIM